MLKRPLLVAEAHAVINPTTQFPDSQYLGRYKLRPMVIPKYGQDLSYGNTRVPPTEFDVGSSVSELIPKMRSLLRLFAPYETHGTATGLFERFFHNKGSIEYYRSGVFNAAAANHTQIQAFMYRVLNAPTIRDYSTSRHGIHQALKGSNWNLSHISPPKGLTPPAFNNPQKRGSSNVSDFDDGFKVMINDIQHVYVIATFYEYIRKKRVYNLALRYLYYDVFGLDDGDLDEFGVKPGFEHYLERHEGFNAWWQLQHQFGFAPLITCFELEKRFTSIAAV